MPIGVPEMVVVLIIALIVLGPKRLPEAGRGLGRSMREFKESLNGFNAPEEAPSKAVEPPAPTS